MLSGFVSLVSKRFFSVVQAATTQNWRALEGFL